MLKLKEIRKQKGLTQKDIGEILNVSKENIYRIEKGLNTINHNQIIKLCKALDIRADELLGLNEKEKSTD